MTDFRVLFKQAVQSGASDFHIRGAIPTIEKLHLPTSIMNIAHCQRGLTRASAQGTRVMQEVRS